MKPYFCAVCECVRLKGVYYCACVCVFVCVAASLILPVLKVVDLSRKLFQHYLLIIQRSGNISYSYVLRCDRQYADNTILYLIIYIF